MIRLAILIHLSKESLEVEVQHTLMASTLDADTFATWAMMTLSHLKNFSNTCSLASRQEAETCKDHFDNIIIKLRRKILATYVDSSVLYCFSSSLRWCQAFLLAALFKMALPTATVSNATTTSNSNL